MTRSALYRGRLRHVRSDGHARRFAYPVYLAGVDLDELPALDRDLRLFAHDRRNLFALRDADYGCGAGGLRAGHAALLAAHGLPRPARVELVTWLRTAGYVFNPVSFFIGRDAAGRIASVVAEVRNNYGGRHPYVLGPAQQLPPRPGFVGYRVDKAFFVSPFLHGAATYDFWFRDDDGGDLDVHMDVRRPGGARVFMAHLRGRRTPLTDRALATAALRYPLMTVQVIALIYAEALYAHLRGVPYRRPGPDHAVTEPPPPRAA